MFNKKTAVLLATVSTLAFGGTAQADEYYFDSIIPGSPYATATISYSGELGPNINMNPIFGSFTMVNQTNPGLDFDFKAFCIDIFNTVELHKVYEYSKVDVPNPSWDQTTANQVNYLFNTYAPSIIDSTPHVFQALLWEIVNERSNPLSFADGDFKLDNLNNFGSSDMSVLEDALQDIQNNGTDYTDAAAYEYTFWKGYDPAYDKPIIPAQTLISWKFTGVCSESEECFNNPVPEPGSLLLISLGLFVLGFIVRKNDYNQPLQFAC